MSEEPMAEERLRLIAERAAKARRGDWYHFKDISPPDSDFIWHARTDVPELLQEVRRLKQQVAQQDAQIARLERDLAAYRTREAAQLEQAKRLTQDLQELSEYAGRLEREVEERGIELVHLRDVLEVVALGRKSSLRRCPICQMAQGLHLSTCLLGQALTMTPRAEREVERMRLFRELVRAVAQLLEAAPGQPGWAGAAREAKAIMERLQEHAAADRE